MTVVDGMAESDVAEMDIGEDDVSADDDLIHGDAVVERKGHVQADVHGSGWVVQGERLAREEVQALLVEHRQESGERASDAGVDVARLVTGGQSGDTHPGAGDVERPLVAGGEVDRQAVGVVDVQVSAGPGDRGDGAQPVKLGAGHVEAAGDGRDREAGEAAGTGQGGMHAQVRCDALRQVGERPLPGAASDLSGPPKTEGRQRDGRGGEVDGAGVAGDDGVGGDDRPRGAVCARECECDGEVGVALGMEGQVGARGGQRDVAAACRQSAGA